MQSGHMDNVMMKALENFGKEPDNVEDWAKKLEDKIKVETDNLPAGMRTPTETELAQMVKFAKDYKKQSPKASDREIRRATQRKFNVKLLPNT